jgi:hypothetical protein
MATPDQPTVLSAILLPKKPKRATSNNSPKPSTSYDDLPSTSTSYKTASSNTTSITNTTDFCTHGNRSDNIYYTFILHKTNFTATPSPLTPNAPNFASFDHGDHIHIVFGLSQSNNCSHSNNCSRSINKILQFLKAAYPGTAEANTTIQQIRNTQRFLALSYM